MERAKVEEFLQPKAMLTPGIAGGVTMLIANALWVAFSLPPRWTSLVLSFLLGLLVFVATRVPLWQRAVYYLLNSLIIFSVSIGTNYVGVGLTHPPARQTNVVEPAGSRMFFGDWLRVRSQRGGATPSRTIPIPALRSTNSRKASLLALGHGARMFSFLPSQETPMRIVHCSFAAVVTLLATPVLSAQAPSAPKPGPEHQKLAYFAGRWNEVADMKPGLMGPGGKMTTTSNCEWFPGGFYLVCRGAGRGPAGENHGLGILGYSTERKRYTYYGIDNSGMGGDIAYGQVTGDTWSWEGESLMGGKTVKGHYVIKVNWPDSYTWKWEMSIGGGPMTLVAEGTQTRLK